VKIPSPVPGDLARVAASVVWFMPPDESLAQPRYFLAHLVTYGTEEHLRIARQYVEEEDFLDVLQHAPVGVFTIDAWRRWHGHFGVAAPPPRPRRVFPGGAVAPLWEELARGEKSDL